MSEIKNNKKIIVYTDNYWLFKGIQCLLDTFDVALCTDWYEEQCEEIILIVDNNLLINGDNLEFSSFVYSHNIDRIVWLVYSDTGLAYPFWSPKDRVINIKDKCMLSAKALRRCMLVSQLNTVHHYENLTETEDLVLDFIMKGFDIVDISKLTGKSSKNVYQHRSSIARKLGYKNNSFLQYVFMRNANLMWTERSSNR